MEPSPELLRPWPPPFSSEFVDEARRLFDQSGNLLVVGPLGSNRGALAREIVGETAVVAWGRDANLGPFHEDRFAVLNHLLPSLRAQPEQSIEEVVSEADHLLESTFGTPTALVREADLCDDASIGVLGQLVDTGRIALVSTASSVRAARRLLSEQAARIDIDPLDEPKVAELVSRRFGARAHPTAVRMLVERSQGAYAVLKELADAGYRTGQLKVLAGQLVIDERISVQDVDSDAVASTHQWLPRFAASHPARDGIDVFTLLYEIDRAEADRAFGPDNMLAAVNGGFLLETQDTYTVASRVEVMRLARALTEERRRELFDRYGYQLERSRELRETAVRAAAWMLSVEEPLPGDLAARATTQTNREGRYSDTLRFAAAVPAASRNARLVVEQAHALNEVGAMDELADLLREVDLAALEADDLWPALMWSARALPQEEFAERYERLGLVVEDDLNRQVVVQMADLTMRLYSDDIELFRRELRRLIRSGHLPAGANVRAQALLAEALRMAAQTGAAVDAADAALDLLNALGDGACAHLVESTLETQILCLMADLDFVRTHEVLTAYSAPGVRYGHLGRVGTALWGLLGISTGDIGTALAHAQLCLAQTPPNDPHLMRPWLEAMAAQVLAQVGDIDRVTELLDSSMARPPVPARSADLGCRITQSFVLEMIGDPELAIQTLRGVIEESREHGFVLKEIEAAAMLVQVEGPKHLDMLTRAVQRSDPRSGVPAVWSRFAEAIDANDMRGLVELAEELHIANQPMLAAAVAQFTLDVARRASDMSPQQRSELARFATPVQHRHVTRLS